MTSVLAGAEGCKFKRNLSEPPARGRAAGEQSRDPASARAAVPQRTSYFVFEMAALRPTSASTFLDHWNNRGKGMNFSAPFWNFRAAFSFRTASGGFEMIRVDRKFRVEKINFDKFLLRNKIVLVF